ncbi:cysteine peptidase family C39 domain-containing protein [Leptolyngbya sp. AS-A5]|nr:cysteine peptidase family C39 domain-containing protein [Leptolyngbya sp. FACHB-17]
MVVQQERQDIYALNLPWDEPPLSLLNDEQQLFFRQEAQVSCHQMGEVLWSSRTPGSQLLVISGKVRLVQEPRRSALEAEKSVTLKPGDGCGDALELVGYWKARAASKKVVVVFWQFNLWQDVTTHELKSFWADLRWRYQPLDPRLPHPVSGYPYEFSLNTAAACLTMVTQQMQTPVPLKQVQRQVRGQAAPNLVEAGEKLGLHLHHIQTDWSNLKRLSFPALLHWQQIIGCWCMK